MSITIRLFSLTLIFGLMSCPAYRKATRPSLSINVKTLGFKPVSRQDWKRLNKEFFEHPNMMDVESEDLSTKIAFISDDTLAISWTRGPNGEVRAEEPLLLQARFVDTDTGMVKSEQSWPMKRRRFKSTGLDCEGRIFPVAKGRFIVCANHQLMLYSSDFQLLRTLDLKAENHDLWSVQIPPGGISVFLRDEAQTGITYTWLDSDTLAVSRSEVPPHCDSALEPGAVTAFDNGYYGLIGNAVRAFPASARASLLCPEVNCKWKVMFGLLPLADGKAVVDSQTTFTVFDQKGNVVWVRQESQEPASTAMKASLDGHRFVFVLTGSNIKFEDENLRDEYNYFIYDVQQAQKIMFLRALISWDADFALSPNGSKFAEFHETVVNFYDVR